MLNTPGLYGTWNWLQSSLNIVNTTHLYTTTSLPSITHFLNPIDSQALPFYEHPLRLTWYPSNWWTVCYKRWTNRNVSSCSSICRHNWLNSCTLIFSFAIKLFLKNISNDPYIDFKFFERYEDKHVKLLLPEKRYPVRCNGHFGINVAINPYEIV